MKIRVFTLCWGTAWERYGERFAKTFAKYWPETVEFVMVSDRAFPLPRGHNANLTDIEGQMEFRQRWKSDPAANGKRPPAGAKRDESGYAWRFDALKWMPQGLAPLAALEGMNDGDILVWFDADVETTRKVPIGWVGELLGDGNLACLQRGNYHSEIGFYAVRIDQWTRAFLKAFAAYYVTDAVFGLKEWHSAFVFDTALAAATGIKVTNLNPAGGKGHVWPITALQEFTTHHKGKRKDQR